MEGNSLNVIPTKEQIEAANNVMANNVEMPLMDREEKMKNLSETEKNAINQLKSEAETEVELKKSGQVVQKSEYSDSKNNFVLATGVNDENDFNLLATKPKEKEVIFNLPPKNYNEPSDTLPLPSGGKIYKHKKNSLKVAYLTAVDEDLLTSPNLLKNENFLNILLDRKILEDVSVDDLHTGDRNAIMIWLRATAYGSDYPITIYDNNDQLINVSVDLSTLKYKKFNLEPDEDGLISYQLPISKKNIKFRFLTCGDIDDIEKSVHEYYNSETKEILYKPEVTIRLSKVIVEVDGVRDRDAINNYVRIMLAGDTKALTKYYNENEPGVDLRIKVDAPGGSIETFLPININFFWPEY